MSGSGAAAEPAGPGPETLLFGIGNSGRGDDGLGWAFLDRVQQAPWFGGRVEYRYQLQVEDAALLAGFDRVIFVDAYRGELEGGVDRSPCEPSGDLEFSTHILPPPVVLHYARALFGASPRAELLLIQGERWGLCLGLSEPAEANLGRALQRFEPVGS